MQYLIPELSSASILAVVLQAVLGHVEQAYFDAKWTLPIPSTPLDASRASPSTALDTLSHTSQEADSSVVHASDDEARRMSNALASTSEGVLSGEGSGMHAG